MSSVKNREYGPDVEQEAFSNLLSDIAGAVRKMPEDLSGNWSTGSCGRRYLSRKNIVR